jgi:hypothetical protein
MRRARRRGTRCTTIDSHGKVTSSLGTYSFESARSSMTSPALVIWKGIPRIVMPPMRGRTNAVGPRTPKWKQHRLKAKSRTMDGVTSLGDRTRSRSSARNDDDDEDDGGGGSRGRFELS